MYRLTLLFVVCIPLSAMAQAPNLNPLFPCGAQRGTTLELPLRGQNLQEPLGLLASFPVKVTFNAPSTDSTVVVARLVVPNDAPLGWHTIRLHTKRGISNVRPFCIDELPQAFQTGSPFSNDKAQEVKLPRVVCGTMQPDQRHYYSIQLNANQRLCAEIIGRRLGSPLDPALTLFDAATGNQVAFSDDAPGLQQDARFAFIAPKAGKYHLEVRDVTGAGGSDRHYRLRLGDFPLASTSFPLAIRRGSKAIVNFTGPLVEQTSSVELMPPTDPTVQAISVTPRFSNRPNTQAGWPVQVMLTDLNERTANIARIGTPQQTALLSLTVPEAISAVLLQQGEKHTYRFTLQAGVRYLMQTITQELGSPASLNITLRDAKGTKVAGSNPDAEATRIEYMPQATGEFVLTVEHQHYGNGPDQSYRLSVTPVRPSFSLSAIVDCIDVARGNHAVVVIHADRSGGYNGPIELKVEQPQQLTGSATISANQASVMFPISAGSDMPLDGKSLVITGTGQDKDGQLRENVRMTPINRQTMSSLAYPPLTLSTLPAVSIQPAAPFTLKVESLHRYAVRGLDMPIRFTLNRKPGFNGEVSIQSIHLPGLPDQKPSISSLNVKHATGQSEAYASHQIAADAPDRQPVAYQLKSVVDGREVTITTLPMEIQLGPPVMVSTRQTSMTIKSNPLTRSQPTMLPQLALDLLAGPFGLRTSLHLPLAMPQPLAANSVEVLIERQGGYSGAVQVKLVNLPDRVVAGTATVPSGKDRVLIPITAMPGAKAITTNNVKIEATVTSLGNQKAFSQPLSVTIK